MHSSRWWGGGGVHGSEPRLQTDVLGICQVLDMGPITSAVKNKVLQTVTSLWHLTWNVPK